MWWWVLTFYLAPELDPLNIFGLHCNVIFKKQIYTFNFTTIYIVYFLWLRIKIKLIASRCFWSDCLNSHLLSYLNSCCNPLVYGFMSRNFRRGFKAALRCALLSLNVFCLISAMLIIYFNYFPFNRLRGNHCYSYFCYCHHPPPRFYHIPYIHLNALSAFHNAVVAFLFLRNVRRSVYKFSHGSRNSRITNQLKIQDPG